METNRKSYIPLVILLWALVPLYYFTKNTFFAGTGVVVTLIESILTIAVLNFSSYFLGGIFFRVAKIDRLIFPLKRLYKVAAGYGVIFFALTLIGLAGLYNTPVLSGFIIILVFLSMLGIREFIAELPINRSVTFSGTESILLAMTVFTVLLGFILTLTPPTIRDSIIHHLAVPKLYLKGGGIVPLEFMSFSFRSLNLELLYLLALFIKNDIVARAIHFNFYILCILAIYYFLRANFQRRASLAGMLIFASIPVVFNVAASAYVDLGVTFFAIMLLNAVLEYHKDGESGHLKLAGAMAGLTISTKINGYLFVLFVFLWLLAIINRKHRLIKDTLKCAALFLVFTFIFDVHLITKNLAESKNPFYPALKATSGEGYLVDGKEVRLSPLEIRRALYGHTLTDELLMPWRLSTDVHSRAFYTVDGVLGPVFIIFIPFIFFLKKRRFELYSMLLIACLFTFVCWIRFDVRLRYLFLLFPLGLFIVAAVAEELFEVNEVSGRGVALLPRLFLSLLFIITSFNLYHIFDYLAIKDPVPYVTSKINRDEYLRKHYKPYKLFEFINREITEKDARIYFLDFGTDGYYCDIDYIYDSRFLGSTLESAVKSSKDADELYERIKKMGITHILTNKGLLQDDFKNNYNESERLLLQDFFGRHLRMIKRIENDEIYAII